MARVFTRKPRYMEDTTLDTPKAEGEVEPFAWIGRTLRPHSERADQTSPEGRDIRFP